MKFRIMYQVYNHTRRAFVRCQATTQAGSAWGALRCWWQQQGQYYHRRPVLLSVQEMHAFCPRTHYSEVWCTMVCSHQYEAETRSSE